MIGLSTMQSSPWQSGLDELYDFDVIRQKILISAIQVQGLKTLPVEQACEVLKTSLKKIFIPSDVHCGILRRCVGRISAFSSANYPDVRTYLGRVNAQATSAEFQVMCLTGVAGLGKSELLKALERLLPAPRSIRLNDEHPEIHINLCKRMELNVRSSPQDILRPLSNPIFLANRTAIRIQDLLVHLRQWFYIQGLSLLVLDEFQFLSLSNVANTLVAKTLMMMGGLNVPVIFISNFSMSHRLLRRPQEERQRLLAEPIILEPEHPDSPDWLALIREYVKVDLETLCINPEKDAAELNRLTAGIPRLLRFLFVIAFRIACHRDAARVVNMTEINIAYQSAEFCIQRADVEALASLAISKHLALKRLDLVCPLQVPLPWRGARALIQKHDGAPSVANFQSEMTIHELPTYQAAIHMRESALNVDARALLKEVRGDADLKEIAVSSGKPKVKKVKVTAESLYAGAEALRVRESVASRLKNSNFSDQEE